MVIKTTCPQCGKKKAIKNVVTFIPGDCIIKTVGKGCHKCGYSPDDNTQQTQP